jgi:hypothetical protein
VAVNSVKGGSDTADEGSFEDTSEAAMSEFVKDGGGVAVDGMGIEWATFGELVAAVERDAVSFADKFSVVEHPDGNGVLEKMALFIESEAEIGVVLAFEGHGAGNRVTEAKGDEHGWSLGGSLIKERKKKDATETQRYGEEKKEMGKAVKREGILSRMRR